MRRCTNFSVWLTNKLSFLDVIVVKSINDFLTLIYWQPKHIRNIPQLHLEPASVVTRSIYFEPDNIKKKNEPHTIKMSRIQPKWAISLIVVGIRYNQKKKINEWLTYCFMSQLLTNITMGMVSLLVRTSLIITCGPKRPPFATLLGTTQPHKTLQHKKFSRQRFNHMQLRNTPKRIKKDTTLE